MVYINVGYMINKVNMESDVVTKLFLLNLEEEETYFYCQLDQNQTYSRTNWLHGGNPNIQIYRNQKKHLPAFLAEA